MKSEMWYQWYGKKFHKMRRGFCIPAYRCLQREGRVRGIAMLLPARGGRAMAIAYYQYKGSVKTG